MLRSVFTKTLWDQRRASRLGDRDHRRRRRLRRVLSGHQHARSRQCMESSRRASSKRWGSATSPRRRAISAAPPTASCTILLLAFGSALGIRAIAGDEEAGLLDVLLAHPIERTRFLVERAAAMFVALAVAGFSLFLVMVAIAGLVGFEEIGAVNFAAASVQIVLLGSFFGALALFVGAATGKRSLAAGAVAIVGVLSYFANTLGPSIDLLRWTRDLSPFHYYSGGQPLRNGIQYGDAAVLVVAIIVLIAVAAVAFRPRDIGVIYTWP